MRLQTTEGLDDVRARYRKFLGEGKAVLDDAAKEQFTSAYDGGFFKTGITEFLADPVQQTRSSSPVRWIGSSCG
jgi:hypothetical protein